MTQRLVFESDREFRLWRYFVGHGQLLLRSPSGPEHDTCVDVLFKGVSKILSETAYDGLRVFRADGATAGDRKVFHLQSTGHAGSISALAAYSLESEIGYHDEGLLWSGAADSSAPIHQL